MISADRHVEPILEAKLSRQDDAFTIGMHDVTLPTDNFGIPVRGSVPGLEHADDGHAGALLPAPQCLLQCRFNLRGRYFVFLDHAWHPNARPKHKTAGNVPEGGGSIAAYPNPLSPAHAGIR